MMRIMTQKIDKMQSCLIEFRRLEACKVALSSDGFFPHVGSTIERQSTNVIIYRNAICVSTDVDHSPGTSWPDLVSRTPSAVVEMKCRPGVEMHMNADLLDQYAAHRVDALSVHNPINRKADAIDIRAELDQRVAPCDPELLPEHLVATVAGPDRGPICRRWHVVGVYVEPQRPVAMQRQIAAHFICSASNHEVANSIRATVERKAQTGETRSQVGGRCKQDTPEFLRLLFETPILNDLGAMS